MHNIKLFAKIDAGGRLAFDDPAAFAKARAELKNCDVEVYIQKRSKRRSLSENGYYWGVVIPLLCDWCGFSKDEMHDALKNMFLATFDEFVGLKKIKSTSQLNSADFEKYMSQIRTWASGQGVFIPLPNEDLY